jgi:hypothetical protein
LYGQSRRSVLEAAQNELFLLVEHPEIVLSIVKEEPLTAEENLKLDAYLTATLRAREYAWLQYKDGAIDEGQWTAEILVIRSILDSTRTRAWWNKLGRSVSSPEFVEFVEKDVLSQPLTGGSWRYSAEWTSR